MPTRVSRSITLFNMTDEFVGIEIDLTQLARRISLGLVVKVL